MAEIQEIRLFSKSKNKRWNDMSDHHQDESFIY